MEFSRSTGLTGQYVEYKDYRRGPIIQNGPPPDDHV